MEPDTQQAPPVVAVVVVHEPGPWFEETIDAFADQDYPNLRFLFLTTGTDESVAARLAVRMPGAYVRDLGENVGFGSAVNEVVRLVEGDKGFFLVCHDDIAPDPDAVRMMVEEIYRSNAGVVGPKLVEWDDPGRLQVVGLGVDRFGEIDRQIDTGELDQEQHDGVRDVFAVPSACMLVRADLFRAVGGFDEAISFHGDDVELCWRVHHSGARVVVAPSARVRHLGGIEARRPDLAHRTLRARHRVRAVATATGPTRLPGRLLEMTALTVVELVLGLFTGRFGEAWASTRALFGLAVHAPSIVARRRVIAPMRQVPERDVIGLQVRGSARLSGYLRERETSTFVGAEHQVRRWRESTSAPVVAWVLVLAAVIVGSRDFVTGGVPPVGEFFRFVDSPRDLLSSFASGWNPTGAGATSSNPSGWATLSALSVVTLFHMGLLQTVVVVGMVVLGLVGLWKLATVFPSTRARVAALVVYAASPLVAASMASGAFTVLVAYASTPWIVHAVRRAAGVETADPRAAELDLADGIVRLAWPQRLRRVAQAAIVVALASAFAPVMLPMSLVLVVLLSVGSLLAMTPWRTAADYLAVGAAAVVGGAVLNFPWITTWSWRQLVGASPIGDPGRGLLDLASFRLADVDFTVFSVALYLPVVASIAIARAWRLTWAVRAGVLVVVFGFLAVLGDRGSLPFTAPEAGVLLVPVALGLAVSAAAALAAFDLDVRGGTFGWRQPLGLLAGVSIVVGVFPGVMAIGDGSWGAPTTPLGRLLDAQLPDRDERGAYNVLLIGDARILPVPSVEYRDGVSYAIVGDDGLDVRDRWAAPMNGVDDSISLALDEMASSSTLRAGRLLAPLAIRFIVVPEFDNVVSTTTDPLPLPGGLVEALEDQLDLTSVTGLPTLEVYENTAWMPKVAQLTGDTAEASRTAGASALVRAEFDSVTPLFSDVDPLEVSTDDVEVGVVHLAVPFDSNWVLTVDGETVEPRRAFGISTAFDVGQAGTATLEYRTPTGRSFFVALQVALWLAALVAATRSNVGVQRRSSDRIEDETLIDLDDPTALADPAPPMPVLDPGLDMTGQIARTSVAVADPPEVSS